MTVTSTTSRMDYPGTGSAGPFAYTFKIFAYSDLLVTKEDADGVETTLVYPTDFSATGAQANAGGTITLSTALATGENLSIRRVLPLTQLINLRNQGSTFPQNVENGLDQSVMRAQQLDNDIESSVRLAETTDPADFDTRLPANMEAGDAIVVNAAGTGFSMAALTAAQLTAWSATHNLVLDRFTSGIGFTPGVSTTLALSANPGNEDNLFVTARVSGTVRVYEHDEYSVSGTTLTFGSVIPAGATYIEVSYMYTYQVNISASENITYQQQGADAVSRTTRARLREKWSVLDFGATGNGSTDDTAAIQNAIDGIPEGATLEFPAPSSFYLISDALDITQGCQMFTESGAEIRQSGSDKNCFNVSASNVTIRGFTLRGPQSGTQLDNERAVNFNGASAAAPLENVVVKDCHIERWGMYAIYGEFVTEINFSDNWIEDINYAGIAVLSAQRGVIQRNRIKDVDNSGANAYGIIITRRGDETSLSDYPRSKDLAVSGNTVQDIPLWTGIDTHAGERISFVGNVVHSCYQGILVGSATDDSSDYTIAPLDCVIANNIISSGLTSGVGSFGISFTGTQDGGVPGAQVEYATGVISGNVVRGFGDKTTDSSGAIHAYTTRGLVIQGNTIIEPSPYGIMLYQDNEGFVCLGNTIIDPWSGTITTAGGIYARIEYNFGVVSGNIMNRGAKVATYVCERGVEVNATTNQRVTFGANDFNDAESYAMVAAQQRVQHITNVGFANDRGDAAATLVWGTDAEAQVWATALGANRAVTLQTTMASGGEPPPGAQFHVRRTGGGAFDLTVNGVILAQAEWITCRWTGAAWITWAFGTLN